MATMNFPKIGAQGYSLGSLHLNSEEFVWTSADKSRYERRLPDSMTIPIRFREPLSLSKWSIFPLHLARSPSRWMRQCGVLTCMRPNVFTAVSCGAIQLQKGEVG